MRKSIYFRLCGLRHLISSIRFNFHYFSLKSAVKLPVMFYSPVKLREMKGKIVLDSPVRHSMVSIGLPGNELFHIILLISGIIKVGLSILKEHLAQTQASP